MSLGAFCVTSAAHGAAARVVGWRAAPQARPASGVADRVPCARWTGCQPGRASASDSLSGQIGSPIIRFCGFLSASSRRNVEPLGNTRRGPRHRDNPDTRQDEDRGDRRTDARLSERVDADVDDQCGLSHGVDRRPGRDAAGHERGDCACCQPERTLCTRVAGCDGHLPVSSHTTRPTRPISCRQNTRRSSPARRAPRIWRFSPRSCRRWRKSKTASSTHSSTVAACPTPRSLSFSRPWANKRQIFDATLSNVTLELVPGLTDRLRAGIDVADIGCGTGSRDQPDGAGIPEQPLHGLRLLSRRPRRRRERSRNG